MATSSKAARRTRGGIETLPSGSLRVKVYAGIDPLTKKRHYLVETVPAGPRAYKEAEKVRTRLLAEVDERRNPRTKATLNQLLDRWLTVVQLDDTTRNGYVSKLDRHVRPALGTLPAGRIDAETLESFYAELRRCRERCTGRQRTKHRTAGRHKCDDRCVTHTCEPLAPATVRQLHAILSGAFSRGVRWKWLSVNPASQAEPPAAPKPNPRPPSAEQAARIVNEAWHDLEWGMLVWLVMVTGVRRGELCALAWDRLDFATGVLSVRSSIAQIGARTWEKDTKTHQQRRITLDEQTLGLLGAYHCRCEDRAAALGIELPPDARMFSQSPDGSTWLLPDSVTKRYTRMCARLEWDMNIHQLRHYSATELIGAGVDVRTVAGRLGHGGGGATTLRVYAAWRSESDQRAAGALAGRMPALPVGVDQDGALTPAPRPATEESAPYLRIAADLQAAITCGAFKPGDALPPVVELATRYGVAPSTAHRAIAELASAGLVVAARGSRAKVAHGSTMSRQAVVPLPRPSGSPQSMPATVSGAVGT